MHGKHIKIVAEGARTLIGSPDVIREFIVEMVSALGMRLLASPTIFDVAIAIEKLGKEPFEDEGGVTGVGVLSTSHVSIHTWPAREAPMFVLDVYSCRDFDAGDVIRLARERLGMTSMHVTDLSESLRPPNG